jgi:hypothetical protein
VGSAVPVVVGLLCCAFFPLFLLFVGPFDFDIFLQKRYPKVILNEDRPRILYLLELCTVCFFLLLGGELSFFFSSIFIVNNPPQFNLPGFGTYRIPFVGVSFLKFGLYFEK